MIGRISNSNSSICNLQMKKISQFKVGTTPGVNTIHAISESEAWIHKSTTTFNTLFSTQGEEYATRELNASVFNFDMLDNQRTVFCDDENKTVITVEKSGDRKVLFCIDPLYPIFVSVTHTGDLLISMQNEYSSFKTSYSRGLVRKMTISGDVIRNYEFLSDGKTPLFHSPRKAVEHYNGNVSVINRVSPSNSIICGLDIDGNVIFRYTGQKDKNIYIPLDICCDMLGNTISTDAHNRTVHVIDMEGKFVRYLVTRDMVDHDLYSVSLYNKKVWVGAYGSDVVSVFECYC